MKKICGFLLALVAISGVGYAQKGFGGPALSGQYFPNIQDGIGLTLIYIGGQVGAYELAGPLGVRATGDFSISPVSGFFSLSADALFSSGGDTNIYGGVGVGLLSVLGVTAFYGKPFAGVEFPASDAINIFVEASPLYVFQAQRLLPAARAGVNFEFGD